MNYKIEKSRNSTTGSKNRYVAKVCHDQTVEFDQFIKEIQDSCSLKTSDLRAAVDAIGEALVNHLQQGDIVELPQIGRFKIEMECKPVSSPDEFRVDKHLKRFQLHVIPYSYHGSQPLYDDIELHRSELE